MTEHLAATLPGLGFDVALAALPAWAGAYDCPCREVPGGLAVEIWGGEVRLVLAAEAPSLAVFAPDMRILFVLQDALGSVFEAAGCAPVWDRVDEGALAPGLALMRVVSVRQVSPGFRRVRLAGPEAARFAAQGLHFRLLLPPAGRVAEWPRIDARGRTRWPEGAAALHRPVYTVRDLDGAAGWLDFDIFVHEGGGASEWSGSVQPGAEVGVMGPGGGWVPEARHVTLIGDETALPAIARILSLLPAGGEGSAHVAVAAADLPDLPRPAGMALHRAEGHAALLEAVAAAPLPERDRFVWFAAEKRLAEAARKALRARGLGKTEMMAAAYWAAEGEV
jgi:NADPH-dependent ferric siderophore reductase